jgi:hypothetical protein
MSEDKNTEFSILSCGIQTLVAYCAPITLLVWLSGLVGGQDTPLEQVLSYVFVGAAAFALALAFSAFSMDLAREGRLAWVLPAILFATVVIWQVASQGVQSPWREFFFVPGPGHGEEGWVIFILTLPTWSCCCYSTAMCWRHRAAGMREKPVGKNASA